MSFYDSCVRRICADIQYEFPQANTIMSFVKEHGNHDKLHKGV